MRSKLTTLMLFAAVLAWSVQGNWSGTQRMLQSGYAFGQSPKPRPAVLISDLHFGVGKDSTGQQWDPTEDFRWSKELEGFLDKISKDNNEQVDLVIAGDLLELWQPPAGFLCKSDDQDLGCTVAEMTVLVEKVVVPAHRADLELLGKFASRGQNRLFVIPGNHDAALLLPNIWAIVYTAMKAEKPERVRLVDSGVWTSDDKAIVAEHGHQIGKDVNQWEKWPKTITVKRGNTEYLIRPWGEYFVQKRFNEREQELPIIDNLSPETAGVRYYMAALSLTQKVSEWASFLKFNLIETSLAQEGSFLRRGDGESPESSWDLDWARRTHGYKLFADALRVQDPVRTKLKDVNKKEWDDLRKALSALAMDKKAFPDEELQKLCAQLAIRAKQAGDANEIVDCTPPELAMMVQGTLVPRDWIMKPYLENRLKANPKMRLFVYGHTHVLEYDWELQVFDSTIQLFNTGAFQRVIDDETFMAEANKKTPPLSPAEALRTFRLDGDEMPACYSAVFVTYADVKPIAELKNWHVRSDGKGELVSPCHPACAKMSKKCSK